jgi:hypothetical protein
MLTTTCCADAIQFLVGDPWDGELAAMVQAWSELTAGDLRLLYLAWLLAMQWDEVDDEATEPPVPAGLGSTPPHHDRSR